jgi:hypothetical protein
VSECASEVRAPLRRAIALLDTLTW